MRAEILVGPERRRRWGAEDKARMVAEAALPDAKVAEIARCHGVSRGLIYTWRREASQGLLGDGARLPDLVPVLVSDASEEAAPADHERRRVCASGATKRDGAIKIVLPGGVCLTVQGRVEERTLRAVLRVLRSP